MISYGQNTCISTNLKHISSHSSSRKINKIRKYSVQDPKKDCYNTFTNHISSVSWNNSSKNRWTLSIFPSPPLQTMFVNISCFPFFPLILIIIDSCCPFLRLCFCWCHVIVFVLPFAFNAASCTKVANMQLHAQPLLEFHGCFLVLLATSEHCNIIISGSHWATLDAAR